MAASKSDSVFGSILGGLFAGLILVAGAAAGAAREQEAKDRLEKAGGYTTKAVKSNGITPKIMVGVYNTDGKLVARCEKTIYRSTGLSPYWLTETFSDDITIAEANAMADMHDISHLTSKK